jgi:hypothetical protein
MKKIIAFLFSSIVFVACNDSATTSSEIKDSSKMDNSSMDNAAANNEKIDFVYTTDKPSDWVPGDPNHAAMVMKGLKGYETGNIDEIKQYFSDSVVFRGDNYWFKGSRDSLISEFKHGRSQYKDIAIKMQDWESVKSKARGEEYVSMWYTEKTTDKNGKVDSANYMDDVKIVNGKIVEIDSKIQHYPKKKM